MRVGALVALLVVLATSLTFGLFVHSFGLYYDDYPSWQMHLTSGPRALVDFTAGQGRPLVGLLPALAGSVAGSHWLMYLVHTSNGLLVLALLRRVWPGLQLATGLAALLFCVYPGYWLRPTHIALSIDGSLLLALLSLWAGQVALERAGVARIALATTAALLVPAYLLLYELPVGLEFVRPIFVALSHRRTSQKPGMRRLLVASAPCLVALTLFAVWRVAIFRASGDYLRLNYNAVALPAKRGDWLALASRLVRSCFDLCFGAWRPSPSLASTGEMTLAVALAAVLAFGALVWFWYGRHEGSSGCRAALEMGGVGILIVVAGQCAPLATGRVAASQGLSTRWALVSSLGAAMVWGALAAWRPIGQKPWLRAVAPTLLIGMVAWGAYRHVDNAFAFSRDWDSQRSTWWQVAWRLGAPSRDAVLVIDGKLPLALDRERFEYELTLSAELFFGAERGLVATTSRLAAKSLERIGNPRTFEMIQRRWVLDLEGMVLVVDGNGCLEVKEPDIALPEGKTLSADGRRLRRWSQSTPIDHLAHVPSSRAMFGPEPDGWCRVYQMARRAEKESDDVTVIRLGEEALAHHLHPTIESEWGVFRRAARRVRGRDFPGGVLR